VRSRSHTGFSRPHRLHRVTAQCSLVASHYWLTDRFSVTACVSASTTPNRRVAGCFDTSMRHYPCAHRTWIPVASVCRSPRTHRVHSSLWLCGLYSRLDVESDVHDGRVWHDIDECGVSPERVGCPPPRCAWQQRSCATLPLPVRCVAAYGMARHAGRHLHRVLLLRFAAVCLMTTVGYDTPH
jgi:hypothetical protein